MPEQKTANAKIDSVSLGIEDHGLMTMYLHCSWSGGGCGFGGYRLDQYNHDSKKSEGTGYGLDYIMRVLETVGVSDIKGLTGKYIRVKHTGCGGGIQQIGHITEDKWFNPKEHAEAWKNKQT